MLQLCSTKKRGKGPRVLIPLASWKNSRGKAKINTFWLPWKKGWESSPRRKAPDPQMTLGLKHWKQNPLTLCSFREGQCELPKQMGDGKHWGQFPLPSHGGGSSGHSVVQTVGCARSRSDQLDALGIGLVGSARLVGRHTSGLGAFLAECWIPDLHEPVRVVQR